MQRSASCVIAKKSPCWNPQPGDATEVREEKSGWGTRARNLAEFNMPPPPFRVCLDTGAHQIPSCKKEKDGKYSDPCDNIVVE